MDEARVKSILAGLEGGAGGARALASLLALRRDVLAGAGAGAGEGVRLTRALGGLGRLVALLRRGAGAAGGGAGERLLDLTLSALGNCCLEEESSLAVGQLNAAIPLVTILKTNTRDSIVGRACRLIGNLAQKTCNAELLHTSGAVTALIAVLEKRDKSVSYPTLTMAVRAIRLLWMVPERRDDMLGQGAVRAVAVLLTAECEAAGIIKTSSLTKHHDGIRRSQEELFAGLLKCIGYFTTLASVQCAEQLQGDGRGYQCLVSLTKAHESSSLKCLMNLCFVSSCRPLLGTAGVVECLVKILQKHTDVEMWPEGSARALAQLSGEAVNRSRLRHCGGLPLLVAAARVCQFAMHALLQYVFDDTAFQMLINEGLVNLLTDELTAYVSTMEYEHNSFEEMEVKCDQPPTTSSKGDSARPVPMEEGASGVGGGKSLLMRRKSKLLSAGNEDELKVVIERDNMIVGFMDAVDSEASDQSDDDDPGKSKKKGLKRARSSSPQACWSPLQDKSQLIKMSNRDWSASIYWEPKCPEWPTSGRPSASRSATSPERPDCSPWSGYSDGNQSGLSPEYRSFASQSKRPRWDWSPESSSAGGESSASPHWAEYQWSPGSSGAMSPCSRNDDSSDSEQSGRYSPVCSDAGEDTNLPTPLSGAPECDLSSELNATQMVEDLDDLIMEDEESLIEEIRLDEDPTRIDSTSKSARIACVLVLLFRVSHGATPYNGFKEDPTTNSLVLELLTRNECLSALLDYVERCKRPLGRAARILARILSNALSLTTVLRNRLAMRLHKMTVSSKHPTTKCRQCKQIVSLSTRLMTQLRVLAESDYGIGEISYQLLKGHPAMQQTLSITLPYIVRTEKPLKKYFVDCSALDLLLTSITESKESFEDWVPALAKLASNLQVRDPKEAEQQFKDHVHVSYDPILDNLASEEIVTFELDDSSKVEANKVFLCQNSDVFNAMLMGQFKESIEKCVRLKKVTKPGLEYMLTLLHCGLNSRASDLQTFPLSDRLETNLEVLLLADRFLFEEVSYLLRSAIIQFQLSPKTAGTIYKWSLGEGMGMLCSASLAFMLTGKMREDERTRTFSAIFNMEYKQQLVDDIKSMIVRHFYKW